MTDIVWPDVLRPKSVLFDLDAPSKSGGASTSGVERIVAAASVRWKATLKFMVWGSASDPDRILAWRAVKAQALGRVGSILIGPHDWLTPARLDGRSTSVTTTHSDGAAHADGTPYRQSTSSAVVMAAAPLRSSVLSVAPVEGWAPRAGQYFGIGIDRLHMIARAAVSEDGAWSIAFAPPLRAAVAAGDLLEFETPRCRMRLAADDSGALEIGVPWVAEPSIDLVEIL